MSIKTIYRANNKLQVCFTEQQISFLRQQSEETGDTMNSSVRHAVNNYHDKMLDEKIENLERKL